MAKNCKHLPGREKARELARLASTVEPSSEARRAREDFVWFCYWLTRNQPEDQQVILQPHHLEWIPHLITGVDSRALLGIAGDNIDLLSPRGSAKSTVLGLYIAWVIGVHTQAKRPLQILYISANVQIARAKSATIKQILEAPEYREIFPSVVKGRKWSDEYWSIDRRYAGIKTAGQEEFTMACAGISGTITSKRSHLVILDDLIKSPDDIASPDVREKMMRNWSSVIRPTMFDGGRAICLGTRFRPDDIHATTFTPEQDWIQIEQQAILTNDKGEEYSYWEKFWSLKYLRALRKADPTAFQYQYQNQVGRISDISIDPAWIHYGTPPATFDSMAVGVDLASSLREKADYTVFTLVGKKGDHYWVLDYRRGKWVGNMEKCDVLLGLYEEWYDEDTPFLVFVEEVAYQASFKGDFVSYVLNGKGIQDIQCYPRKMKGDKLAHLLSVTGIYANGLVRYNQFKDLSYPVQEMTNFGAMPHDDCLDSAVLALQGMASRRRLEAA